MTNLNENIIEALNKYSDTKHVGADLQSLLSKVSDAEPIIPVLGMQGMGKSTLINALLEENILPNETDETTCVPVEIKYGTDEHADVYFQHTEQRVVVNDIEGLRQYDDNNSNPANEKEVLKIVLYRCRDFLKKGITIVDLPGVGSLTAANESTTMKYIQNLCTAIFMIPTVPTIRKHEAMFIKGVWSQFPQAIFVQNDWGDSQQEKDESVDYNTKVLRKIASQLKTPFNNDILVINAYNALAGALTNDLDLRASSNIEALIKKINQFSTDWKSLQNEGIKAKIIQTLDGAIMYAKRTIHDITASREEVIAQRQLELLELQRQTNTIEEDCQKIISFVGKKLITVRSMARSEAEECVGKIRQSMNRSIDAGVYDGEALTTVFNDVQNEYVSASLDRLFDEISQIKFEIDAMLQDLCQVSLENDMSAQHESVDKKHGFRYEKGLDFLFKIGGGVGGLMAGAKAGAVVGTAICPGAGTVVGLAVGVIVGMIGSVVGSLAKKKIGEKRAAETKKFMQPYYEKIEDSIKNTIINKFTDYSKDLKKSLNNVVEARREVERSKSENINVFTDENQIDKIKGDIKQLSEYLNSIK